MAPCLPTIFDSLVPCRRLIFAVVLPVAPAPAVVRLQHEHFFAGSSQQHGRHQPRQSGADDRNVDRGFDVYQRIRRRRVVDPSR